MFFSAETERTLMLRSIKTIIEDKVNSSSLANHFIELCNDHLDSSQNEKALILMKVDIYLAVAINIKFS